MGLYSAFGMYYGFTVDLSKSTNEQIKKMCDIISNGGRCYKDFIEFIDAIVDMEGNINRWFIQELIGKILQLDGSKIKVTLSIGESYDLTEVFFGVQLKCLCDTKSGYNVVDITPMSQRRITELTQVAKSKYDVILNKTSNLLFDRIIESDIVFISDVD